MRVCESLMKRGPPMPHDFAHDGMESRDWRMLAACLDEDPAERVDRGPSREPPVRPLNDAMARVRT